MAHYCQWQLCQNWIAGLVDNGDMTQLDERAIAHVAGLADGGPGDPSWRVTLHFHPDRLVRGMPILRRMTNDGVYRSQFETGTSNGGLTASPGGDRWLWESRIFGGAYDDGPAVGRPKYGALNFRRRSLAGHRDSAPRTCGSRRASWSGLRSAIRIAPPSRGTSA